MTELRKAESELDEGLRLGALLWPRKMAAELRRLHEENQALRQALAQPEQNREAEDQLSQENDGCPTEKSVLQRFWRGQEIPKEHYPSWFLSTKPVDTVNTSQERETAKRGHEPVACKHSRYSVDAHEQTGHCYDCGAEGRMKFVVDDAPPKREWVGLTDGERRDIGQGFENDNGQLAKDCALSDLRKALEKTCPPCFGDCNQGRDCPARKEQDMGLHLWLFVLFLVVVIIVGIYIGYDE